MYYDAMWEAWIINQGAQDGGMKVTGLKNP